VRLHIQHGHVIDPANGVDRRADVFIAEGMIISVGAVPEGFVADRVLDASRMLVLPGLVDLSARVDQSGDAFGAALAGGVTSLVQPPQMPAIPLSPLTQQRGPQAKVYPLGALTLDLKGQALTEMVRLTEAGCVGFSQGNTPVKDTAVLLRALQYAKSFDYAVWLQPQDAWLSQGGVVASGAYASRLGLAAISVEAETIALQTLLSLQRATGVSMHLCRLSSAEAIECVRAAKKAGQSITCDVTANHMHLTDVDIGYYDSHFRLDPPLRGQRDRDAIRLGLLDGTIDAVCSDHTPLTDLDKHLPFADAVPGAIGLELLLSLTLKWAQEARVPLRDALKLVTCGPGHVLAKSARWPVEPGGLTVGAPADVCVVDPEEYWLVRRENIASPSPCTPFLGRELPGRVVATVLGGDLVWERSR
jgi:dihydroorotase